MSLPARVASLRRAMASRGLNARQVSDLTGVRHQTVRCYLCGVRPIPKGFVALLRAAHRDQARLAA